MAIDLNKSSEEIFKRIVIENNRGDATSIPHSDHFDREMESMFGIPEHNVRQIINLLKESHRILTIEIEKEDRDHGIKRVEGYVEADLISVRKLREAFNKELEDLYARENGRKILVNQIIKELFPHLQRLKGSPLGIMTNKAIMLNEFERMIERNYDTYNHEWKEKKFAELMKELDQEIHSQVASEPAPEAKTPASKRAADFQGDPSAFMSMKSINRMLNIYGVDFFFRINIRNYNFDFIREAIERGVIDKRPDLVKLKDMLVIVRSHFSDDPELAGHEESLQNLERALTRFRLSHHL